ncbi:ATP-binding cassette domain-containing protein [Streptomyces sp. SP17BM10]|uniref:ATP-binding cassette domain-containing protein n=1 Tax=Streptomyces sp. SP17BM10 TaxID=3002530 RepID=UPI002E75BCAD|nr:ATP-binding cassette domain-containing protein [Streptomyces sp. SP17BM10]MEE1788924.1 ATP-binding cassette domain-containing protein [Streptomyces sp. SP17BM10]
MELAGVGKRYGRGGRWVLRGVDLAVRPGELVRIAGANGTGKSTLLRLVAGIERPSAGRVVRPGPVAYVPERFPPALPFDAASYLLRVGWVHGLTDARARRGAQEWLDRFGIADRAGTPLSRLSKGTCQKVAVAQALLPGARVLLLDEAWTGLDPAARTVLDEAAAERAAGGGAVLFVDHDPARLAGLTTAAYRVGADGGLRPAEEQVVPADGPPVDVNVEVDVDVLDGGPLPAWLPGAPELTALEGTAVRLTVAAAHSDALLRRLLTGRPAVSVLAVRRREGKR